MLFEVFFKCLLHNNYLDSLMSILSDPVLMYYINKGLSVLMHSLFG